MLKRMDTGMVAALMIALVPAALLAQRAAPATRVPLTITLVRELPHPGTSYEIQRRTSGDERDVVLLLHSATPEQLSEAIRGVMTARLAGGDSAAQAATLRVRPHSSSSPGTHAPLPWALRVLADLRAAPMRNVPGVGRVQAVRIWLPAQHRLRRPRTVTEAPH